MSLSDKARLGAIPPLLPHTSALFMLTDFPFGIRNRKKIATMLGNDTILAGTTAGGAYQFPEAALFGGSASPASDLRRHDATACSLTPSAASPDRLSVCRAPSIVRDSSHLSSEPLPRPAPLRGQHVNPAAASRRSPQPSIIDAVDDPRTQCQPLGTNQRGSEPCKSLQSASISPNMFSRSTG
jgi:hypothetical protein